MSEAAKSPAKKKPVAPKKQADHPPYIEMIKASIVALKERNGSSRQAIEKYIKANYKVGEVGPHLKMALKRGAAGGKLLHTKGVGASGSFKVPKEEKKEKKPKKKPAAKKSQLPNQRSRSPRRQRRNQRQRRLQRNQPRKSQQQRNPQLRKQQPRSPQLKTRRPKSLQLKSPPRKQRRNQLRRNPPRNQLRKLKE